MLFHFDNPSNIKKPWGKCKFISGSVLAGVLRRQLATPQKAPHSHKTERRKAISPSDCILFRVPTHSCQSCMQLDAVALLSARWKNKQSFSLQLSVFVTQTHKMPSNNDNKPIYIQIELNESRKQEISTRTNQTKGCS